MALMTMVLFAVALGRMLTGAILLIAGIAKLKAGYSQFTKAILGYDIVPEKTAWILARGLPWAEVVSGGLLVVGFFSQMAAIAATTLLLLFSSAIALSLLRGRDNDCGCFNSSERVQRVQWRLIYRNVALMAILLAIYAFAGGALSLDRGLGLQPNGDFTNSTGTIVLTILWMTALFMAVSLQIFVRRQVAKVPTLDAR